MRSRGKLLRYALLVLLPVVIAGLSALAGVTDGQTRTVLILATIGCVLMLSSLNAYQEILKSRAIKSSVTATAALGRALGQAGQPLITLLGKVAVATAEEDRRAKVSTLVEKTVGIARSQCGRMTATRGNVRAAYYHFVSDDRLVRQTYEGRIDRVPRPDFVFSRSANDRAVIELARGEDSLLVKNIDAQPPHNFADYSGRPYCSFLTVPVRCEHRSFGFLSIDSDRPDSLTDIDVGYVTLMAGILAAAFALLDLDGATEVPVAPRQGSAAPKSA